MARRAVSIFLLAGTGIFLTLRGEAIRVPDPAPIESQPGSRSQTAPDSRIPALAETSASVSTLRQAAKPGATRGPAPESALPLPDASWDPRAWDERRITERKFIASLYRDFGGLRGNKDAIALWADLIAAGTLTREQAVEQFIDSVASLQVTEPLARLYLAYFQRAPDEAGWSHWRSLASQGQGLEAISDAFSSSPEFAQRYGAVDDRQFVEIAYRNTLGRAPGDSELGQWQSQLSSGLVTRGQLMLALSDAPEFRQAVANEVETSLLYSGLLGRTPDATGFSNWVRARSDGALTRSAMIAGFLDSPEYQARTATAGPIPTPPRGACPGTGSGTTC